MYICMYVWVNIHITLSFVGRDFDLLRDSSLTGDDEAGRWRCEHCFNQIDLEEVENRLVCCV